MKISTVFLFFFACVLGGCKTLNYSQANANNQDWQSFGRDYTSQRFSPARQINTKNVKDLAQAWVYKSGVVGSFQTTPIVQNGIMYLSLPFNHVVALDAKTGSELWRYNHDKRADWKMCCGRSEERV